MSVGEIIITDNIEREIENLTQSLSNFRVFQKSDFNMDEAKMVLNESAISSNTLKSIILAGDSFNVYAQNALLKILEEPPPNTHFILITKSKNSILATILSRMIIHKRNAKKVISDFPLDLKTLNLNSIKNYVENLNLSNKEEARELVESLLFAVKKSNINLSVSELDSFNRAFVMLKLYEMPKYIFLQLLLMILEHSRMRSKEKICLSQK